MNSKTFSEILEATLVRTIETLIEGETMSEAVKQTTCRHCTQDIENAHPYRKGEWRDRGNNTHCPNDSGKVHAPYIEKPLGSVLKPVVGRTTAKTKQTGGA